MNNENPVKQLQKQFPDAVGDVQERSASRMYVSIVPSKVKDIAAFMFVDLGARFIIMTGLETRAGMEILYHFSFDSLGKIVTLRTVAPMPEPTIDSIAPIIDGAEYIEREIRDLFGVEFVGHPNPVRFLLADDWPEGVYPYRKEFRGQYPFRTEEEQEELRCQILRKGTK
ncbi:MAG: NADH-quinone oxidoreductase subunit C [Dehalococcoidia bacterium]|nr:NADH-quinone oxidoreductase subunit C [Dehalococcoidia bacterium]